MSGAAAEAPAGTDSGTDARATTASEADADPDLPGSRRGRGRDESELFEAFNRKLVRIVSSRVNTSAANVEDACGFAWLQFMQYQPERDRGWRAWLITTAEREAWKLHRAQSSALRLVSDGEYHAKRSLREPEDPRHDQWRHAEAREALEMLAKVPERRRRALALHVSGLTYDEIAAELGVSRTRVNHLVAEANAAIRKGREQAERPLRHQSDRALRLEQLETDPPRWLVQAIGRRPGSTSGATVLLAWRRAALAIDDYRKRFAPHLERDPLGGRPLDANAARAFDLACRAADRLRAVRTIGLER